MLEPTEENMEKIASDVVDCLDDKAIREYAIQSIVAEYRKNEDTFQSDYEYIFGRF